MKRVSHLLLDQRTTDDGQQIANEKAAIERLFTELLYLAASIEHAAEKISVSHSDMLFWCAMIGPAADVACTKLCAAGLFALECFVRMRASILAPIVFKEESGAAGVFVCAAIVAPGKNPMRRANLESLQGKAASSRVDRNEGIDRQSVLITDGAVLWRGAVMRAEDARSLRSALNRSQVFTNCNARRRWLQCVLALRTGIPFAKCSSLRQVLGLRHLA